MATIDGVELTLERLQRFHPLALIAEKHIGRLLEGAALARLEKGKFLFRKMPQADTAYFLLEGEVEVRESFERRTQVEARGHQARFPLEELCRRGASVRALTDALVLTLKRDAIDRLIASADEGSVDAAMVSDA